MIVQDLQALLNHPKERPIGEEVVAQSGASPKYQVTVFGSFTSSVVDPEHVREKSASPEKEVVVVAKKGSMPAAEKVLMPPLQSKSEDPPVRRP